MTAAGPSGVVTFLFTDVEGSTRRWEANAHAMRAALAAHDEVLRKAIEAHGHNRPYRPTGLARPPSATREGPPGTSDAPITVGPLLDPGRLAAHRLIRG
jgi:hypothetical protein